MVYCFCWSKKLFPVIKNANQTFIELFCNFFDLYKENNSSLIWFLRFSELFPAFNWAKEIGNVLSIWLGVSIFSLFLDEDSVLLCEGASLLSTSGIYSRHLTLSKISLTTFVKFSNLVRETPIWVSIWYSKAVCLILRFLKGHYHVLVNFLNICVSLSVTLWYS